MLASCVFNGCKTGQSVRDHVTVDAIDRIIHHATIIEIEVDSYRKKQSLKK
jgi:DNA replication protein DnaC